MCPGLRRGWMLAGVGLVLDNQRLFSLAGRRALALIEDEIGLAQPSDGAQSRPPVPATYLRIHRVCQRFQAICPWSCAHTFSAKIDPLKPKSPLFSMSQPPGERSNMPTDRKLGADFANGIRPFLRPRSGGDDPHPTRRMQPLRQRKLSRQ